MLKSMTAFAKSSKSINVSGADVVLEIELKTLNSRFLDIQTRIPREYNQFEKEIREVLKEKLKRGRVEVTINRISNSLADETSITFNKELYTKLHKDLISFFNGLYPNNKQEETISRELLLKRDLYQATEERLEISKEESLSLLELVNDCTEKVSIMRAKEGEVLEGHIIKLIGFLEQEVTRINEVKDKLDSELKDKILAKYEELLQILSTGTQTHKFNEDRLLQEVAILQVKADISEELIRLDSHIAQYKSNISTESNGKKLDFITQECLREVNTIASKSSSSKINEVAIEAKNLIEQLKEQVANVE